MLAVCILLHPCLGVAKEPKEKHREFTLTLPGKEWSLILDLPGFEREEKETRPDDLGVVKQMVNDKTGLVVTAFIEASPSPTRCRPARSITGSRCPGVRSA